MNKLITIALYFNSNALYAQSIQLNNYIEFTSTSSADVIASHLPQHNFKVDLHTKTSLPIVARFTGFHCKQEKNNCL